MSFSAPRRILLAVTGLTPQVVTETIYALACDANTPWVPTEVHLITTDTGADNARLNLLGPKGQFYQLCADYGLPQIDFPPENIHVLKDADGQALADIRTQADNTLAADFIVDMVRALTADDAAELHVSIAGGRKTMGYYLGYALSLYGRPQDRLSHVLVSDPYETNREFYYPTPYEKAIHIKRGDKEITVDAHKAEVSLASIPFVRLREELPPRLLCDEVKLSQVVERANRALQPPLLVLDTDTQQVWADDQPIPITPTEFLVLLLLAVRAQRGEAYTAFSTVKTMDEFLGLAKRIHGSMSNVYEHIEESVGKYKHKPDKRAAYFGPYRSRITDAFEEALGRPAAARYGCSGSRNNQIYQVALKLEPQQIEIRAAHALRVALGLETMIAGDSNSGLNP